MASNNSKWQMRLSFGSLISLFLVPNMAGAADDMESIAQKFIGDYELVSYFRFPADGGEVDMKYIGRLSYDAFGNMSGLGMPIDFPGSAAQTPQRRTAGFAYWGKVSIDVEKGIVIHHVEGSPMIAAWVGGDNVRYFEFVDDLLKLSLKNSAGEITGTLTWRRLK